MQQNMQYGQNMQNQIDVSKTYDSSTFMIPIPNMHLHILAGPIVIMYEFLCDKCSRLTLINFLGLSAF